MQEKITVYLGGSGWAWFTSTYNLQSYLYINFLDVSPIYVTKYSTYVTRCSDTCGSGVIYMYIYIYIYIHIHICHLKEVCIWSHGDIYCIYIFLRRVSSFGHQSKYSCIKVHYQHHGLSLCLAKTRKALQGYCFLSWNDNNEQYLYKIYVCIQNG